MRARLVATALLVACGGGGGGEAVPIEAPRAASASAAGVASTPAKPSNAAPAPEKAQKARQPDGQAIYARVQADLARCFEKGKKSTPEMSDGKVTLNVSSDASGKTACAIPSDAKGLTQEVQDCMAARLETEKFEEGPAWSTVVPVAVRAGAVHLGEREPDVFGIQSIETVRMPDAFDVMESLVTELEVCAKGADRSGGLHRILVGARVGTDGRATCSLATSTGVLPAKTRDCAAGVLRGAKYPPPKRGSGFVLVPINLLD